MGTKFQCGEITEEHDEADTIREYEAKIAALERKVGQLTMELELLKKHRSCQCAAEAITGPVVAPSPEDAKS